MAEIPPTQGSKALKIVLIVGGILLGLCAVCVGATWFMGGKDIWSLTVPFAGLQSAASAKYPQGAEITLTGESPETFTLALGVKGGLKPEEVEAAQDWLWKEYAKAFAGGGFPLQRVAVGQSRGNNKVTWPAENEIDVEVVATRTGVPAPAVNEFLAKQIAENGGSGSVRVNVGGGAPETDDGKTPDEQK